MSARITLCALLAAVGLASAFALAQEQPPAEEGATPQAADAHMEEAATEEAPAEEASAEAAESTESTETAAEPDAGAATEETTAPKPPFLDLRRVGPISGDAAAGKGKAELCAACHGADGVGIAPTFPNLAGQRIDFLYWQLVEFKSGALPNSAMTPLAADLSEQDMRDLAAYYAGMPHAAAPASAEDAAPDAAQLAAGERLYRDGDPAKGIPPCAGCHGADGSGFPGALEPDRSGHVPFASFPALRGQQALYLQTKLAEYQSGTLQGSSTDRVMSDVSRHLDADSIQAISTWLSTQH